MRFPPRRLAGWDCPTRRAPWSGGFRASPAERAGLQRDDVIVGYNGQEMLSPRNLSLAVAESRPETALNCPFFARAQDGAGHQARRKAGGVRVPLSRFLRVFVAA